MNIFNESNDTQPYHIKWYANQAAETQLSNENDMLI